ncbi:MAG TPA: DUF4058 family protein [Gemmataceae bacterium]|nr:DUF4058 family protein [Gemmataceae bacterium]
MPLRDHFHPPLANRMPWDGLYGGWPAVIVQSLNAKLPPHYAASPRVRLGLHPETATATDPKPADEYEVFVHDREDWRRLVAAVELVSPSNKDNSEHRRAFVAKCATFLQQRVSVTVIDVVTTSSFNLFGDLLELLGQANPSLGSEPPSLYAAACRVTKKGHAWQLEAWPHSLALGQPLPTLPLWLADNLALPLELEGSYEQTCRDLRIP